MVLRSGRYSTRVRQDVNAEEAGVAGTPRFFINEVQYPGPYDFESLASVLSRAMASSRTAPSSLSNPG